MTTLVETATSLLTGRASLSRPEQAALVVGRLAEASEPGARLGTKEELRQRCGVAKGTFNEALRILQSRGLIVLRPGPGGGLFAASPDPVVRLGASVLALDTGVAEVAEAVRMRDALDPLLVEDAVDHATDADLARMRQALAEMRQAAQDADATAFVRGNWDVHAAIARCSPHVLLRTLYLSLLELVEGHTLSVEPSREAPLPDYLRERLALHAALVDAIEAEDRAEALRLAGVHATTQR